MEHLDRLREFLRPDGLRVADIGAGNGDFAAALARAGARVTGVEISAEKVARARDRHGPLASFVEGRAEALPLEDGSCDLVTFNFSLHHVPAAAQGAALAEVQRCLRPGGRLHVVEPEVTGAMTEIVAFVDDEREVRTRTARLLADLPRLLPFREIARRRYVLARSFAGFDQLLQAVVRTDERRAARLPQVEAQMRDAFHRKARVSSGRFTLEQPCTAWHFALA